MLNWGEFEYEEKTRLTQRKSLRIFRNKLFYLLARKRFFPSNTYLFIILEFNTFQKGSKGEELINQVCMFLELEEKDFFGLCFFHAKQSEISCWLQSKKPIHKQIGSKSYKVVYHTENLYL